MKVKIFTQANRCNLFLDIWLSYYSKLIDQKDMYIYYENKFGQDIIKYLNSRGFGRVNVKFVDTIIQLYYFNLVQASLLKEADVVMYADPDEIIFSVDLLNTIKTFKDPYLTTKGFEIVHNINEESDYDPSKKIMKQRSFGVYSEPYNKPLILRQPLRWTCTGKHSKDIKMNFVDGLYLIHLCRFDFNTLLRLNDENKKYYKQNQLKCWHHLITEKEKLKEYYNKYFTGNLIEIPKEIKNNLDI